MRGDVTTEQFVKALSHQQRFQRGPEEYAEGFAEDSERASGVSHAQRNDHQALCQALVDMGLMTAFQVERALFDFMQDQVRFAERAMRIPHQVPQRSLMVRTFEIAGEMLSSEWNTEWVTEGIAVVSGPLPLSDCNVRLRFGGGFRSWLFLSAAQACLDRAVAHVLGAEDLPRDRAWELLAELANQISGRAAAAMATQNVACTISVPERVVAPLRLDPERAVCVTLRTGDGELRVALTFHPDATRKPSDG